MNTKSTIRSIYDEYKQRTSDTTFKLTATSIQEFDVLFADFANLLISDTKSIGEFLSILTPSAASNDPKFIRFMDDLSCSLLKTDYQLGIKVLKTLLMTVQKLAVSKKISLTQFIWDRKYFRSLLTHYPLAATGKDYMNESIFSSVFPSDGSMIVDMQSSLRAFSPLFNDDSISFILINYITDIFKKNIGYTYEDARMMNQSIMSRMDMCILCFNVMIEILKLFTTTTPYLEYDHVLKTFWLGVDVVYVTIHIMERSIQSSINYHRMKMTELKTHRRSNVNTSATANTNSANANKIVDQEIDNLKNHIAQGEIMITNLTKYISSIDIKYVDDMIFDKPSTLDYVINNKYFDTVQRLIHDIGDTATTTMVSRSKTDTEFIRQRLVKFILYLLVNVDVPVHIKFNAVRLMLSHNLKDNILKQPDGSDILSRYMLDDVVRLKNVDLIHLIDILIELANTPIIKRADIMEMYLYLIPEFSEQYVQILNYFIRSSDDQKATIIIDLGSLVASTGVMVKNLSVIGANSLSYLGDTLSIIELISDTENIIEMIMRKDLGILSETIIDETLTIFKDLKNKYIKEIKPFMIKSLHDLQAICKIMLTKESYKIMYNILGIDCSSEGITIKVLDTTRVENDLLDSIKYDIAFNPYYITTGDTLHNVQYHIIDRKTYYSIIRSKMNPFTREVITRSSLDALNEQANVKSMRDNIYAKLLQY